MRQAPHTKPLSDMYRPRPTPHRPRGRPPLGRWLALAALLAASAVRAAGPDLGRAGQLMRDGQYEQAYALLEPFAAAAPGDAAFALLLGEAALQTQRAAAAREQFERALAAEPGSVAAHLGLGRAYLALGDTASAKIEFETVLRFDDLPPDLETQARIYAEAARAYAQGSRLLASGYALLGYGNYRVGSAGGGPRNDAFYSARLGGRLNFELDDGYALVGSLDWRFRDYFDNDARRNDSDWRWNAALSRNAGEGNWIAGLRGRVSYRGEGVYRNDFGAYGQYRLRLDEDNQVAAGLEVRQRRYPSSSRLRERTRNIVEATASWTHALWDGGVELDQVGQRLLPLGRAELAPQARHHAGADRGADAEGMADGDDLIAGRQVAGGAHRRRLQIVGQALRLEHGQVVLGLGTDHGGVGLMAVGEGHAHALGAPDHMKVGQDRAVVLDDHAGAEAALHGALLGAILGVVLVVHQADHAHHRSGHAFVGLGRRRRQRLLLQRMPHRGVDLLLRQRGPLRLQPQHRQHQCRGEQRADAAPGQRRQVAAPDARARRCRLRRRVRRLRRGRPGCGGRRLRAGGCRGASAA